MNFDKDNKVMKNSYHGNGAYQSVSVKVNDAKTIQQ